MQICLRKLLENGKTGYLSGEKCEHLSRDKSLFRLRKETGTDYLGKLVRG
jgi:hypothetical protein